ncbi:MAG: methyl-accepting chemotaxis protein [Armatimonadota bacterium]|nr:methyl-accepting chemotaxis protein [Armatimonadota bacterium]MDR7553903.1 methyl-accepting chemotaxis protein [Armatimonadota bacterium]MDR7574101.1 methyl-accepting chemotaxis protein [Armatimonadota bacterium]
MLGWFYNMRTRTRLFLGFGLLTALVVAVAATGYQGLSTVHAALVEMHDRQFASSLVLAEAAADLNGVRALLLGMMATKDRDAQQRLHGQIKDLTRAIDERLDRLQKAGLGGALEARVANVQRVWQEFRDTRDTQLIPAILAGRLEEARALATGIQAERYRTFAAGAAEAISEARQQALHFKEDARARYRWSVLVFVALSAGAAAAGLGLAIVYDRVMATPLARAARVLEAVAAGDFAQQLKVQSRDEVGLMGAALNRAVESVRGALSEVQVAAERVATASQQVAAAAQQLSAGAQEQASSLEETAASLEEITGTVRQNADNARQASQLAMGSRDAAERGGQVVTEAVAAMAEINGAAKKIADIITTIDEIAFQTNLLALNAAVEAARAGEQGRGFAVVAAEVRSLAQRSATAAREIKALIQDSVGKVERGAELVNRSGQTLEEIVSAVKRVTDIIAEIAAASQEQSTGVDQVNKAVTQMDQVLQATAAQTEELSSTAQALAAQAEQLRGLVGRFELGQATTFREGAGTAGPASPTPRPPARPASTPGDGRAPRGQLRRPTPALAGVGPVGSARRAEGDGCEEF